MAVASRREVRGYSDRPVRDAVVRRVLEARRIAGSSRNRQPWRFLVAGDPGVRERVAEAVFAPGNVRGAPLAVAVAVREADLWGSRRMSAQ